MMMRTRLGRLGVSIGVILAALLGYQVGTPRAAEPYVIAVNLLGDPEVGCIVSSDAGACSGARIAGRIVPDGAAVLTGRFRFRLPGFRGDVGGPLKRTGHGQVEGTFMPRGEPGRQCLLKGRVRTQGVYLPASASTLRFYTGTFDARGRCDGGRVRFKAIWSGGIAAADAGEMVFDFERFQGKLVGRLVLK